MKMNENSILNLISSDLNWDDGRATRYVGKGREGGDAWELLAHPWFSLSSLPPSVSKTRT